MALEGRPAVACAGGLEPLHGGCEGPEGGLGCGSEGGEGVGGRGVGAAAGEDHMVGTRPPLKSDQIEFSAVEPVHASKRLVRHDALALIPMQKHRILTHGVKLTSPLEVFEVLECVCECDARRQGNVDGAAEDWRVARHRQTLSPDAVDGAVVDESSRVIQCLCTVQVAVGRSPADVPHSRVAVVHHHCSCLTLLHCTTAFTGKGCLLTEADKTRP
mmetsp:Transcript_26171/g.65066  ORF Transcript_26171/g.65066 Transcript_26171/m.65066 type:complete len:216 (+) Transcript_26171:1742-2389(+)